MKNFEASISVDLFKSSQVDHLFCWVNLPALSGFWSDEDPSLIWNTELTLLIHFSKWPRDEILKHSREN